jgi:hypothetical protein
MSRVRTSRGNLRQGGRAEAIVTRTPSSARAPKRPSQPRGGTIALSERAVDRTWGNAETPRDRSGTQRGPQLLELRRLDADGAPAAFALAMPSRWRSRVETAEPVMVGAI